MCADSFSSPFTENVKQNNKRFVSRGVNQIKWQKIGERSRKTGLFLAINIAKLTALAALILKKKPSAF